MSNKSKKTKSKPAKQAKATNTAEAAKGAPMSNKANDAAKLFGQGDPFEADNKKGAPMSNAAQDNAKLSGQAEPSALDNAPMIGTPSVSLGTLSASDADTELGDTKSPRAESTAPAPKKSMSKKDKQTKSDEQETPQEKPAQPSVLSAEAPAETPDPFRLPRSAFVGLRKSGGLRFTTREVVVYPDGRIAYDARGVPQKEYTRLRRALNDGQVISLRKLLDASNIWMAESSGKPNPDAYAYDIAAHLGQRSNVITVHDGSIPENLTELIERLSKYLPTE